MGFRFWRRMQLAPGVTINFSKSLPSLSLGGRGAKVTLGTHGVRSTVGIPGTGLSYTHKAGAGRKKRSRRRSVSEPVSEAVWCNDPDSLDMGFFKRLFTADDEESLIDACRELLLGNDIQAMAHLRRAGNLADGACLGGFTALKLGRYDEAERLLRHAFEQRDALGEVFSRCGLALKLSLEITSAITAVVEPDEHGVLLGLVEVYQHRRHRDAALNCLERLLHLNGDDVVIKLSLAELLLEDDMATAEQCRRIVELAGEVENVSEIHAALMLYKGMALRRLGLPVAARDTFTAALRRKKERSPELLLELRYQRALVYLDMGQRSRYRAELENLYSSAPGYADVAARLGI